MTKQEHILNQQEGWDVFNCNPRPESCDTTQIQRIDERQVFEDDNEAIAFVIAKAYEGSQRHLNALNEMNCSPHERDLIKKIAKKNDMVVTFKDSPFQAVVKLKVKYPFEEGDVYWVIEGHSEHGVSATNSTWDWVSEEIHDENPNRDYFTHLEDLLKFGVEELKASRFIVDDWDNQHQYTISAKY